LVPEIQHQAHASDGVLGVAVLMIGLGSLLMSGAAVAATGTLTAALAPNTTLALTGIVATGLGTSVCAPTILSPIDQTPTGASRASAVSVVTTLGYAGFLIGPAAIGMTASVTNLRTALACVSSVALILATGAAVLRKKTRA
jgi:hypothetical protein